MEDWKKIFVGPAGRALEELGIRSPEDASRYSHSRLEELHGMGKKALILLESGLESRNLDFADDDPDPRVEEYIAGFSGEVNRRLLLMRELIRRAIPKARETVAYGMPTYRYRENLVHFAGYKNHIGFYPTPEGILKFREEFADFPQSKGAVQFPLDRPLPEELVTAVSLYRYRAVRSSGKKI